VRFTGIVHELVEPALRERGIPIEEAPFLVHHYPHLRDTRRLKAKQNLYLRLGQRKVVNSPGDATALIELGDQHSEMKQYEAALKTYREALALAPDRARVWKDVGGLLLLLGHGPQATRALDIALELDPAMAEAWRNLGVVHVESNNFPRAVECFTRALEINPAWRDGHRYLSIALESAGRIEEALTAAREAVKQDPASRLARDQLQHLEKRTGST